nr:immunoglobulin light chain junction region [Macaca mulatta]
CFQGLEFPWTF